MTPWREQLAAAAPLLPNGVAGAALSLGAWLEGRGERPLAARAYPPTGTLVFEAAESYWSVYDGGRRAAEWDIASGNMAGVYERRGDRWEPAPAGGDGGGDDAGENQPR